MMELQSESTGEGRTEGIPNDSQQDDFLQSLECLGIAFIDFFCLGRSQCLTDGNWEQDLLAKFSDHLNKGELNAGSEKVKQQSGGD
mmetsp:Transcript_30661/g.73545  ORF Transcript_30661/g.73545 Transcript_30661/m.73545 type:complete len:86 (-) Transcript_30661:785-1042(-)